MIPQNFNWRTNVAMEHNVPSIADGGTTKRLTSKYKQNDK